MNRPRSMTLAAPVLAAAILLSAACSDEPSPGSGGGAASGSTSTTSTSSSATGTGGQGTTSTGAGEGGAGDGGAGAGGIGQGGAPGAGGGITGGAGAGGENTGGAGGGGGSGPIDGTCEKACDAPADCCPEGVPGCPGGYPFNYACTDGICTSPGCMFEFECTFNGAIPDVQCFPTVRDGVPYGLCAKPCEDDLACDVPGESCVFDADFVGKCLPGPCATDDDCAGRGTCREDGSCGCAGDRECSLPGEVCAG